MTSRAQAIADAGHALAVAEANLQARTPSEAAAAAHRPGGPSEAELEAQIRAERGLIPEQRRAS